MIIQFHTPKGIVTIDSDTVTDKELTTLKVTRAALEELIPRDLAPEFDNLKVELRQAGG
ncbi:hypothetical protein LCGC14_0408490 [marine sediment metagenome]|uniref:Uncharacterized protein n=1 Tax=marine sediment metagenome TaxID=412755 RepID=A0A0F9TCE4_9ZZZZ